MKQKFEKKEKTKKYHKKRRSYTTWKFTSLQVAKGERKSHLHLMMNDNLNNRLDIIYNLRIY